jgi:hypothetical protein
MLARLSLMTTLVQDLKKIDYTGARVKNLSLYDNGAKFQEFSSPSFQELRKTVFMGIETPDLLSGSFSSITDKTNKGTSFKKHDDFCGWMCPDDYEYCDGECMSLYIRNSSANEVMNDVLKALDGKEWSQRLFKFGCHIDMVLKDGSELSIKLKQ